MRQDHVAHRSREESDGRDRRHDDAGEDQPRPHSSGEARHQRDRFHEIRIDAGGEQHRPAGDPRHQIGETHEDPSDRGAEQI